MEPQFTKRPKIAEIESENSKNPSENNAASVQPQTIDEAHSSNAKETETVSKSEIVKVEGDHPEESNSTNGAQNESSSNKEDEPSPLKTISEVIYFVMMVMKEEGVLASTTRELVEYINNSARCRKKAKYREVAACLVGHEYAQVGTTKNNEPLFSLREGYEKAKVEAFLDQMYPGWVVLATTRKIIVDHMSELREKKGILACTADDLWKYVKTQEGFTQKKKTSIAGFLSFNSSTDRSSGNSEFITVAKIEKGRFSLYALRNGLEDSKLKEFLDAHYPSWTEPPLEQETRPKASHKKKIIVKKKAESSDDESEEHELKALLVRIMNKMKKEQGTQAFAIEDLWQHVMNSEEVDVEKLDVRRALKDFRFFLEVGKIAGSNLFTLQENLDEAKLQSYMESKFPKWKPIEVANNAFLETLAELMSELRKKEKQEAVTVDQLWGQLNSDVRAYKRISKIVVHRALQNSGLFVHVAAKKEGSPLYALKDGLQQPKLDAFLKSNYAKWKRTGAQTRSRKKAETESDSSNNEGDDDDGDEAMEEDEQENEQQEEDEKDEKEEKDEIMEEPEPEEKSLKRKHGVQETLTLQEALSIFLFQMRVQGVEATTVDDLWHKTKRLVGFEKIEKSTIANQLLSSPKFIRVATIEGNKDLFTLQKDLNLINVTQFLTQRFPEWKPVGSDS